MAKTKILARLVNNNLYIPDLADSVFPLTILAAINQDTIQLWHSRLEHLGKQNVLRLATMSKGIDLSKPPPTDACPPCAKTGMKLETHKDPIEFEPGKAPLDLAHSDVHGPFPQSYDGAKYFVIFLDDWEYHSAKGERLMPWLLLSFFQRRHERGDFRVHGLRTDSGGEI